MFDRTVTLAITGASGAQYGLKLLECLIQARCKVYLLISGAAHIVIETETERVLPQTLSDLTEYCDQWLQPQKGQLVLPDKRDWFSPVASGSSSPADMVICPASGGTLSAITTGASNNLIERAADVALKERRRLLVVPREAPYSEIHLANMLSLTRMGAVVIPASPGFYHDPQTIDDLIDFMVARILDQLDIPHKLMHRWGENV